MNIYDAVGNYNAMCLLCAAVGVGSAVIHLPIAPIHLQIGGLNSAMQCGRMLTSCGSA